MAQRVFMARQSIFDRRGRLYGYELLHRRDESSEAGAIESHESAQAMINAIVDVGLNELVGDRPAFVNIPQEIMTSSAVEALPRDRVVLEILENSVLTDSMRSALLRLKRLGYTLALDDFTFTPDQRKFLPFVRLVKVDVLGMEPSALRTGLQGLVAQGYTVLAEKVETPEVRSICMRARCELFQGFLFSRPETVRGRAIPSNRIAALHLLSRLHDPDASIIELDRLVGADVAMSYRVLRLVNSAAIGTASRIDSIRQAVFLLGVEKVAGLASLIVLASENQANEDVVHTALTRAFMCEQLAAKEGMPNPDKHFTVGLFSALDTLLGLPMPEVVSRIPLATDVTDALIGSDKECDVAKTLNCTLDYEHGEFASAFKFNLRPHAIGDAYHDAIRWVNDTVRDLAA